jgi:predicted transporter
MPLGDSQLLINANRTREVFGTRHLMTIAGLSYLTISFLQILAPSYAGTIFPILGVPAFIGELSFCLWLIVKGVNVPKWNEKARLAGSRS